MFGQLLGERRLAFCTASTSVSRVIFISGSNTMSLSLNIFASFFSDNFHQWDAKIECVSDLFSIVPILIVREFCRYSSTAQLRAQFKTQFHGSFADDGSHDVWDNSVHLPFSIRRCRFHHIYHYTLDAKWKPDTTDARSILIFVIWAPSAAQGNIIIQS